MPAIAALTINDGQTTPAAHTFSVVTTDGKKAQWADRSSATIPGNIIITDEVRNPTQNGGAYRRFLGYTLPTEGVVDGVTKVVRVSSAQVVFNFAPDSTNQERLNLQAYVINSLNNASVKAAVPALEPFY